MPSLATRNSSTITNVQQLTNATMTTIGNNSIDAGTPSSSTTLTSTSTSTSIANVNVSGTCTFSTTTNTTNATITSSGVPILQQQEQYKQVQQQQQQQQHQQQQQLHHHQKHNYYYPPPAVGHALHYNNNASSTSNHFAVISTATTGLPTFNGNSNLENVAANGGGSSCSSGSNHNNNDIILNYNNGNSSTTTIANSKMNTTNCTPPPNVANAAVAGAPLVSGNYTIGYRTDTTATTTASSSGILSGGSIVGIAPTSAFKKQHQQLHASREDVTSLGGSSSVNSQISTNTNNNNNHQHSSNNTTANGGGNSNNNHNLNSILKGSKENLLQNNYCNGSVGGSTTGSETGGIGPGSSNIPEHDDPGDGLGPLPPKWETAYTERGELYFIDHNTGTSHWLDPRLSRYQKKSLEECCEDELPYGWEKIEDSLYGTYFIDHVNRKTQYENPVLEAKRRAAEQKQQRQQQHQQHQHHQHQLQQQQHSQSQQRPQTPSSSSVLNGSGAGIALSSISSASTLSTVDISQRAMQPPPPMATPEQNANKQSLIQYKFTRNPAEMQGERITATLLKSARGLGITIVGGDDGVEEFLQIKSIVPNGPAWLDGQLQMGDVLVYVNDTCVLGFTHHEMVNVFQSIMPGETVTLEVCRGYSLPFDPNDPNTEVVTTIAVDGISSHEPEKQRRMLMDLNMDGNYNFLDISGASSNGGVINHNLSTGSAIDNSGFILMKKPEVHTFSIVKGAMGFGFTIADSSYGQKVKKILDRACCHQLQEGDILLEINDNVVRNKSHADVVQILKDCSKTEPTLLKIQRPVAMTSASTATSPNNSSQTAAVSSNVANLRKNFLGATTGGIGNNALFRSKTPTADLYSTMQKEILPIRPKTPLVDTRRARVNTPNIELNEDREVAAVNTSAEESALERSLAESKTHLNEVNKSQNSLSEVDAINHDIPFMDPYPKMVTSLGERLAGVSMANESMLNTGPQATNVGGYLRTTASGVANYENQDYVSAGSGNYSSIYGLAQMPPVMSPLSGGLYGPPPTSMSSGSGLIGSPSSATYHHHHESCFCYDCQEFRNNRLRNSMANHALQQHHQQQQQQQHQQQQQQQHIHQQQPSPRSYYAGNHPSQYSPASSASLQAAHIQNERMQKRVNELLNDRRRIGFSPMDHQHHNQLQVNAGAVFGVAPSGGAYSPQQQQQQHQQLPLHHLHQHPAHVSINQQQHSPAQQLGNWSNNAMGFNNLQPAGLMRNGFPDSSDILDGSGEQFFLSEVTLQRQALGFGFRIVGGTEEGSQVTVGHIVPGGAADNDHRITTGDEILSIDGINVVNSSHHKVVSLMGEAALRGQVTMILRRRTRLGMQQQQQQQQHALTPQMMGQQQTMLNTPPLSASGTIAGGLLQHPPTLQPLLRNNPVRYPYDVIVTRHENEGFGFVIISSSNQYYGSTIGKLIPGSPADRCGELNVGDRIIAVNRIDIAGMSHGDVVNLIKESGLHVRLTIGCPKEGAIINAAPTMPAGSGSNVASGSLLLNSAQASPGQVSQSLTPNLQTNLDASTQYFERPLLSGGSNAGSATSSTSHQQQQQQQQQPGQQSPNPLPVPPQL